MHIKKKKKIYIYIKQTSGVVIAYTTFSGYIFPIYLIQFLFALCFEFVFS